VDRQQKAEPPIAGLAKTHRCHHPNLPKPEVCCGRSREGSPGTHHFNPSAHNSFPGCLAAMGSTSTRRGLGRHHGQDPICIQLLSTPSSLFLWGCVGVWEADFYSSGGRLGVRQRETLETQDWSRSGSSLSFGSAQMSLSHRSPLTIPAAPCRVFLYLELSR
jgi:hypothetical protein